MGTKDKKNIASQALLEMESLKDSIKEESKNTLKSMLADVVKDVLRESVEEDEEEKDYEVIDDEKNAEDSDDKDTKDSEKSGEVSEDGAMGNEEEPVDSTGQEAAEAPETGQEGEMNQPVDAQEAPEESGEGEDEWDNYSQYQVGDDTYDLTGEEDYDQIVKVYKLMKDEDQVVVKKDGDTLQLQDNGTGAEYVIDLGTDDDMESGDEGYESEEMTESRMNEGSNDPACVPDEDDEDYSFEYDSDDDSDDDDSDDEKEMPWDYGKHFEGKKSRKTMKESKERKEVLFEVDLGYTDNYQDEDPISGLSNNEPSKSGKSWEKGVPTGTAKPWAVKSNDKGKPFEKTVNEEEADECGAACGKEPVVDESTTTSIRGQRDMGTKKHIPAPRKENGPKAKHHVSTEGNYEEVVEAYKRENKALKECILKLRNGLQEARITNVNLAKVAKLFVENTVSKEEKINILNRFDKEAKTIEQSNALYESINKELNKATVKKNLTLENTMKSESSNSINENKSKDLLNTLDLIRRIENC